MIPVNEEQRPYIQWDIDPFTLIKMFFRQNGNGRVAVVDIDRDPEVETNVMDLTTAVEKLFRVRGTGFAVEAVTNMPKESWCIQDNTLNLYFDVPDTLPILEGNTWTPSCSPVGGCDFWKPGLDWAPFVCASVDEFQDYQSGSVLPARNTEPSQGKSACLPDAEKNALLEAANSCKMERTTFLENNTADPPTDWVYALTPSEILYTNINQDACRLTNVVTGKITHDQHPCKNSYGLFATEDIPAYDIVGWYGGQVRYAIPEDVSLGYGVDMYCSKINDLKPKKEEEKAEKADDEEEPEEEMGLYTDGVEHIGEVGMINATKNTNRIASCVFLSTDQTYDRMSGYPLIAVITNRKIEKDEELLLYYPENYWKAFEEEHNIKLGDPVDIPLKPTFEAMAEPQRVPETFKYSPFPRWLPFPFEDTKVVCSTARMPDVEVIKGDNGYTAVACGDLPAGLRLGYVGGDVVTSETSVKRVLDCSKGNQCKGINGVIPRNEAAYFVDVNTPNCLIRWVSNDYGFPVVQVVTIKDVKKGDTMSFNWANATLN